MTEDTKKELESCVFRLRMIADSNDETRIVIGSDVVPRLTRMEHGSDCIDEGFILDLIDGENIYVRILILSWLHHVTSKTSYMEQLVQEALSSPLDQNERWCLYYQVSGLFFSNPEYDLTDSLEDLLDDLFLSVIDWYFERIGSKPEYIPSAERNKNFILVVTGQILAIQHGPTKTTLDRCQILMSDMGKEVLLINSGTAMPWHGIVLTYDMMRGNYIDNYSEAESITYEDVVVPYYQMENRLPSLKELEGMIEIVRENKPYQIVSIGNGFMEEILCKMVPAIHISLSPSKMGRTFVQYQQIGRDINDEDRRFLSHRKLSERHIISDVFTSHLQPQFSKAERQELGLPVGVDMAVVVGGRLETEITDEFLSMLRPCIEKGLYLLVLGDISNKLDYYRTFLGEFGDRIISPGSVADPLAYLEHCFLYVNPTRMGGGTSSVEAMSKGVPPISIRFGDVYTNIGDGFAVENYDEMQSEIFKYMDDEDYHREQSEKALKRADLMLDSSSAFIRVMNEFEKRMLEDEHEVE